MEFRFCPACGGRVKERREKGEGKGGWECSRCGQRVWDNPVPSVVAVIEKQGKVLLAKRGREPFKGYWDLVGGFLNPGESLEEGLRREIKEELGVRVKKMEYLGSAATVYAGEQVVGAVFKVEVEDEQFKPADDVVEVRWFDKKRLPKKLVPFADVRWGLGVES